MKRFSFSILGIVHTERDNIVCCSICKHDSVEVVAKYFCKNCDQYFCCTCDKIHSRISSSLLHKVVSGSNLPERREPVVPTTTFSCCAAKCVIM